MSGGWTSPVQKCFARWTNCETKESNSHARHFKLRARDHCLSVCMLAVIPFFFFLTVRAHILKDRLAMRF